MNKHKNNRISSSSLPEVKIILEVS